MNTPGSSSRFLDLRALAPLAHMRFTVRRRIEGSYSGRHASRQQGGAGEFVDFREYTGGEDLRRLDWKVFARTGKAFIRLHQDETNLRCVLALDASGSMAFGGRPGSDSTKLAYAQFLATALSHVIASAQDQVGVALMDDTLRELIPPGGTLTHLARVQDRIEQLQTRPSTTMAGPLKSLFEQLSGRGVLLLMSDYLMDDLEPSFGALRLFRHRGWEVIVLHMIHPGEESLPEGSAFRFEGLENEGHISCSPADLRAAYQERFKSHLAMVRQLALAGGCEYRRVSTAVSYLRTLQGLLVGRAGHS